MQGGTHRFQFVRSGGVDQVAIRNGADIAQLETLDQKLWLALACPAKGIELDEKTLTFLDSDADGRIRAADVLAAIRWLKDALRSLDVLVPGDDALRIDSLNDKTDLGSALIKTARALLSTLGKSGSDALSSADLAAAEKQFAERPKNGDGVIPPEVVSDAQVAQVVRDILGALGSVHDRSGKAGINRDKLDAFFAEAAQVIAWHEKGQSTAAIVSLGADPGALSASVRAVAAKVDDYFTRCRMAAYDTRAAALLSGGDADYQGLSTQELSPSAAALLRLPLARIEAGRALPLVDGVNPAWAAALGALRSTATTLLGKPVSTLNEADWQAMRSALSAYEAWQAEKPATPVAGLAVERLREIVASPAKDAIGTLISEDAAEDATHTNLQVLHKLVLFHRDFVKLLNNFVNFSQFYSRSGAMFQAGTLYLDGRSCDLCVRVADAGKHAALAGLSKSYLAYCDCTRPGGEKMTIVAAFTAGDADHLMVGRNGVFYDRQGRDWDATITSLIQNPISIRQAFWAPYKNFVRLVEEQVAKRAAAAEAESNAKVASAATATATSDQTKTPPPAKEPPKKIDIGAVAAIGVAVGGIATFLSSILALFFGLGWWMPAGFLALMLMISAPSMLIAWLKLRQRNLGPLLDANGWAVNGRVRINVPFGGALTALATIPLTAQRSLRDPYLEKGTPWRLYLFLIVIVSLGGLWYFGKLDEYLPAHIKRATVLGTLDPAQPTSQAPAAPPQAPAPTPPPAT
ncbi:MAG: hypothetical protein JNJ46_00100 [Myxococcales bacterium]|nr:hypothetical protein [Myxococcales bacterium]